MTTERYRILLIEGDQTERQYIEGLFEQTSSIMPDYSYAVDSCGSLKEALDLLMGGLTDIDAVLLDLDLPDSVGLNTFHVVSRVCEGSPIIILSRLGDNPDHRLAVLQAGALGCIHKPDLPATAPGECYQFLHRVITQAIASFDARQREVRERVDEALTIRDSEQEAAWKGFLRRYARRFKMIGLIFTVLLWLIIGIIGPSVSQWRIAIDPSLERHGTFFAMVLFWFTKYPEVIASLVGQRKDDNFI